MLTASPHHGLVRDIGISETDRHTLRQLTLLVLIGFACAALVLIFLLVASFQAVTMIDNAMRERETRQVERFLATAGEPFSDAALAAMAERLDLHGARLTTAAQLRPDELAVATAPGSERLVAWMPQLVGRQTMAIVAPLRIGVGTVLFIVLAAICWRVGHIGRGLDRRREAATRLAHTDALTGLGNRRAFDAALAERYAAAETGGAPFVLLMLDLDGFKTVNDLYGHGVGDAVLQLTADRLSETAGSDDVVARLGGDEFAMLRPLDDLDEYVAMLKRRLGEPLRLAGRRMRVEASIGMACSDDFPGGVTRLLQAADIALYRAKRAGPGNAELAVPAAQTHSAA